MINQRETGLDLWGTVSGGAPGTGDRRGHHRSKITLAEPEHELRSGRRAHHVRLLLGAAELIIGSLRRECLDHHCLGRAVPFADPGKLEYDNRSRCHLTLNGDAPVCRRVQKPQFGEGVGLPEVGGLHHRWWQREWEVTPHAQLQPAKMEVSPTTGQGIRKVANGHRFHALGAVRRPSDSSSSISRRRGAGAAPRRVSERASPPLSSASGTSGDAVEATNGQGGADTLSNYRDLERGCGTRRAVRPRRLLEIEGHRPGTETVRLRPIE